MLKLEAAAKRTSSWNFQIVNQSMNYWWVFNWVPTRVCSDSQVTIVMFQWSSVAPTDEFVHWLIAVSGTWANPILPPQVNSGTTLGRFAGNKQILTVITGACHSHLWRERKSFGWISSLETLWNPKALWSWQCEIAPGCRGKWEWVTWLNEDPPHPSSTHSHLLWVSPDPQPKGNWLASH